MDVTTRQTERRIVEVGGMTFAVAELVNPLGWLNHGEVDDELVDTSVMERMEEAGLVERREQHTLSMEDDAPVTWVDVDGKSRELFQELNEPYCRLRPKVEPRQRYGMFDESEDDRARQKACHALARLERRNPDVSFTLDEEELNAIPV